MWVAVFLVDSSAFSDDLRNFIFAGLGGLFVRQDSVFAFVTFGDTLAGLLCQVTLREDRGCYT